MEWQFQSLISQESDIFEIVEVLLQSPSMPSQESMQSLLQQLGLSVNSWHWRKGNYIPTLTVILKTWVSQRKETATLYKLVRCFLEVNATPFADALESRVLQANTKPTVLERRPTNELVSLLREDLQFQHSANHSIADLGSQTAETSILVRNEVVSPISSQIILVLSCLLTLMFILLLAGVYYYMRRAGLSVLRDGSYASPGISPIQNISVTINTYTEYKTKLGALCHNSTDIAISLKLVSMEHVPKEFLCTELIKNLEIQTTMQVSFFKKIMSTHLGIQHLVVRTSLDFEKENNSHSLSSLSLSSIESVDIECDNCVNLFECILLSFNYPNLKRISLNGMLITDVNFSILNSLFLNSKELHSFSLSANVETNKPFLPDAHFPSVEAIDLELTTTHISGLLSWADFYLCSVFDNLKRLQSKNWQLPLESIVYCYSLEYVHLFIHNDFGRIVQDVSFFPDHLSSLKYLTLILSYDSNHTCTPDGVTGWSSIESQQTITLVNVTSHVCPLQYNPARYNMLFQRNN